MSTQDRQIAISASDVFGKVVICYQDTLDIHHQKHPEPFSKNDIIECVSNPDIVAQTGHAIEGHKERLVYYKEKHFEDSPTMMKTIVDHKNTPGVITSMFRTSRKTSDGVVEYIRNDYFERNKQ